MAPQYKLTYFDLKGLAEPIRYLLAYGNFNFEDVRLTKEQFETFKAKTPFGKVPILEFDGVTLNQSAAIARFLAKKAKLTGKDDVESAQIDAIVDTLTDLKPVMIEASKGEVSPDNTALLKSYLDKFEKILKNNGGFFVGKQLTWADIHYGVFLDYLRTSYKGDESFSKEYPTLNALEAKVAAIPQIKKYLDTRQPFAM